MRQPTGSLADALVGYRTDPASLERLRIHRRQRVGGAPACKGRSMPTPFLDDLGSDSEARRIVGVAFEMARVALGLANHTDLANESLARRIIELAKAGERNPDLLCEGVLKEFRERQL